MSEALVTDSNYKHDFVVLFKNRSFLLLGIFMSLFFLFVCIVNMVLLGYINKREERSKLSGDYDSLITTDFYINIFALIVAFFIFAKFSYTMWTFNNN